MPGWWVHNNGNKNTEIDKRISAMRAGFWAYAGIWRCKKKTYRFLRSVCFFKAMVQGAGAMWFIGLQAQKITQSLCALRNQQKSHSWYLPGYSFARNTNREGTLAMSMCLCDPVLDAQNASKRQGAPARASSLVAIRVQGSDSIRMPGCAKSSRRLFATQSL